ncbi:MAG: hypothetical protein LBH98_06720 [Chitinispirillales bacterium]|jgi:hypothetical protein|nr:hypothetical protein [Chitinispirillales bacterium]
MKKLILLFTLILLCGCSQDHIYFPDGFVETVVFHSDIIDVEKKKIYSKEQLVEYIDTAPYPEIYYDEMIYCSESNVLYYYGLMVAAQGYVDYNDKDDFEIGKRKLIINVNPLQQEKFVLDEKDYKSGMPIILKWREYNSHKSEMNRRIRFVFISEQPVILVKGTPEYWADSSFLYKGESYTILPVCSDSQTKNVELDFTYTIKKI